MRLCHYKRMFKCDTERIHRFPSKMFLIICWNRNTRQDSGQWTRNGVPFDFDYVREQTIASGKTEKELEASARRYKKLYDGMF